MSVFARRRASDHVASQSGGSSSALKDSLFFNLRVDAERGSKEMTLKGRDGWGEKVLILGDFDELPVINYHKSGQDLVLCHRTFGSQDCPACEYYNEVEKEKEYKNRRLHAMDMMHSFPVLVLRRVDKPQVNNRKYQVQPIYWFDLTNTNYKEEYYENWVKFQETNEKYPTSKFPYLIFGEKPRMVNNKKQKRVWLFNPLKQIDGDELAEIVEQVDHPFLTDYFSTKKNQFRWDSDYYEMVFALAVVRMKRFVDPSTNEAFDYDGYYEKALEILQDKKEEYPEASIALTAPIETEEDEDLIEDED